MQLGQHQNSKCGRMNVHEGHKLSILWDTVGLGNVYNPVRVVHFR